MIKTLLKNNGNTIQYRLWDLSCFEGHFLLTKSGLYYVDAGFEKDFIEIMIN